MFMSIMYEKSSSSRFRYGMEVQIEETERKKSIKRS